MQEGRESKKEVEAGTDNGEMEKLLARTCLRFDFLLTEIFKKELKRNVKKTSREIRLHKWKNSKFNIVLENFNLI